MILAICFLVDRAGTQWQPATQQSCGSSGHLVPTLGWIDVYTVLVTSLVSNYSHDIIGHS